MTAAGCPSELALEQYLLEPDRSPAAAHLAACPECRARVEAMERAGEEFRREVYPRTAQRVRAAAERPRFSWPLLAWPLLLRWLPVPAMALAALLLVIPRSAPHLGLKGPPLALAVYLGAEGGAQELSDGARVPAAAALRFRVRPAAPCRLWIVSVDGAGEVSRLYPAGGEGGAELAASAALPGGAVLDGQGGPERVFAVCSPEPLPFDELARVARRSAGGGAAAVRGARFLAGLPGQATQASLLLEKGP